MYKQWNWLLLCTIYCFFLLSENVYAVEDPLGLNHELNQLLNNEPDLKGAIIGISIRSGSSGQLIYQHQGDLRLHPASNLKLLTAAAALAVLGKDYSSRTEILTDGKIKEKTLKGKLYLKGKGDPTLLISDFNEMVSELQKRGIRKIDGDLIGDDTWYDDIRYSIDVPWSDETAYYGSQISALTVSPNKEFDQGTVMIEVTPGKRPGKKAIYNITPKTNYIRVINKAVTISSDQKKEINIKREHAKNIIIIEGKIPVKAKETKELVAVWDPSAYALNQFQQSLHDHGIKVNGKLKLGKTPKNAKTILFHDSLPLSERLLPFMKFSNNSHGEMLIKEIGKIKKGEGTWDNGLAVLKNELVKFGVNPNTMVLRDGSGISHINLITANQISQLLYAIQKESWFPTYINSLPIAGVNDKMIGGTLRNRLKNLQGKVRAKTGSITTVTSLSGYVETKRGQQLIFSIIINHLLDEAKGKNIEDRIVTILANY